MAIDELVAERTLRRRALGTPSARSLLFTVLGEYVLPRSGRVWSHTLVAALDALGVEEKSARQAMARTAADGWLVREQIGRRARWKLSDAADELLRAGAERIYGFGGSHEEWDGRWLVLACEAAETSRDVRHRLRIGLSWAGFGPLRPGVWIAAHRECEDEARRVLGGLGLSVGAFSFVAEPGGIGADGDLVAACWDLEELESRYEEFIDTFGPMRTRGAPSSFVALTRLVHEWRKFPFLDPRLPTRLLPRRWSGDVAHDLFLARRAAWSPRASEWFDMATELGAMP